MSETGSIQHSSAMTWVTPGTFSAATRALVEDDAVELGGAAGQAPS